MLSHSKTRYVSPFAKLWAFFAELLPSASPRERNNFESFNFKEMIQIKSSPTFFFISLINHAMFWHT